MPGSRHFVLPKRMIVTYFKDFVSFTLVKINYLLFFKYIIKNQLEYWWSKNFDFWFNLFPWFTLITVNNSIKDFGKAWHNLIRYIKALEMKKKTCDESDYFNVFIMLINRNDLAGKKIICHLQGNLRQCWSIIEQIKLLELSLRLACFFKTMKLTYMFQNNSSNRQKLLDSNCHYNILNIFFKIQSDGLE